MTVKSNTSASWLAEVEKRVEALKRLQARKEPKVNPSTLQKLIDDTNRSKMAEARELMAAARILWEEITIETNHRET